MEQRKSHLPPEIVEIILSKSSGKSLLRFKSVSKSWNTTISDPLFVRNYRHVSKYSNSHHLFLRKILSLDSFSLVKFENGKFRTEQPLESPNGYNKLLCHCDGVLLVNDSYLKKIELWNPSNGAELLFSSPYDIGTMLCYGLCHDPTVGDFFKVVLIFSSYYLVFSSKYKACTTRKEFEDHTGRVMCGSDVTRGSGVSVDGVVYWVLRDKVGTEIIYFDPRDDKFKILRKPESLGGRKSIYLVDLRGCLCVYCKGGDWKEVIIWTKEKGRDKNSWSKLITIENVETPVNRFEPQCFAEDKILIMLHFPRNLPHGDGSRSRLVVYFPFRKTFQEVEEVEGAERYELVPYVDSTFLAARKTNRKRKRKRKCS